MITQIPLVGTATTTLVREGPPNNNFHMLIDAGNVFWTAALSVSPQSPVMKSCANVSHLK